MTFAELKARILSTAYLPQWLKGNVNNLQSITVAPNIEPAPEGTPKWCPLVRTTIVRLEGTTAKPSKAPSHNRRLYTKINDEGSLELIGTTIEAAYCLGDRCQMWDATGMDCGMKNPLLHLREAAVQLKELVNPVEDGAG